MAGDFAHICGSDALPERLRGAVVAIGNFDGVHRGHRAVLDRALEEARRLGAPALVLTFDPHPRTLFRPDIPLFRLTSSAMKARLLDACGFDGMVEQTFDLDFAGLTAEEFVATILVERLGIAHAVTGFDFHFGKARSGGPAFLMEAGGRHGFGVTLVDAFRDEGAEIVSSSRIRDLLAEGEVAEAAGQLGYRFAVEAEIVGGEKLGRTLRYPTANMMLSPDTHLAHGIYAVRMRRAGGSLHDGVASFGRRPTVTEDGAPLLETFLFDFSGDLYGETCRVGFFARLRGEEKFDGLDALTRQMKRDEAEARAVMEKAQPLSELDAALHFAAL
ncbi:bifunctional riboflavin kinase/FAD synthetase [Mesorhizobium sp. YIM 152430]|uniref:bifunctional riboflavin kinase/FAD synthetase n=1 Tax=Mesorhizobium sp. YIM 152430 TaxID=3031761 RepID=UPI0023DBCBA8|nr:bifunctional riboflavin kinase/FAD synthetase [Mesorhizobium sp. YIM 152430]MDF1601130.1 bifunctional riboflavin kinase/FAD synthetase [Mesorhizobium sp. YIM 152430]